MKNTILINSTSGIIESEMISSVDDGTNRLIIQLICEIAQRPYVKINNGSAVYATDDYWLYEIASSIWVGSGTFTVTVGNSEHSEVVFTVRKVTNSTNNVGIERVSDTSFNLTQNVPKTYYTADEIDDLLRGYLPLTGGTLTGALTTQSDTADNIIEAASDGHSIALHIRGKGTTSALAYGTLYLGNNIESGTASNSQGRLRIYGSGTAYSNVYSAATSNRNQVLPDKAGTFAMTSDLNDYLPLSGGNINNGAALGLGTKCRILTTSNSSYKVLVLGAETRVHVTNYANNQYRPIYASSFDVQSSKLVKENIKDTSDESARKILELNVVDFDYIRGGEKNQCGLIAEEVVKILPNCVTMPPNYSEEQALEQIANGELPDVPGIDYSKFTPYLIKLAQIQEHKISELERRLEEWTK